MSRHHDDTSSDDTSRPDDDDAATEDLDETPAVAGGQDDSAPAQGEGETNSYGWMLHPQIAR